jgi:hypothetical protein
LRCGNNGTLTRLRFNLVPLPRCKGVLSSSCWKDWPLVDVDEARQETCCIIDCDESADTWTEASLDGMWFTNESCFPDVRIISVVRGCSDMIEQPRSGDRVGIASLYAHEQTMVLC